MKFNKTSLRRICLMLILGVLAMVAIPGSLFAMPAAAAESDAAALTLMENPYCGKFADEQQENFLKTNVKRWEVRSITF